MPLLVIATNTAVDNQQDLAMQASRLTAEILGKPESYVMVKIKPEQTLIFAGSNAPAAHVKLKSLGLPENRTADYSEKICAFLKEILDIDGGRIYIEFSSPERHMWGWNGGTF